MSDEPEEKFLICVPASTPPLFADDRLGTCCGCGVTLRFRPYHGPAMTPICLPCAMPLLLEHGIEPPDDRTVAEAVAYFAKPEGTA